MRVGLRTNSADTEEVRIPKKTKKELTPKDVEGRPQTACLEDDYEEEDVKVTRSLPRHPL